MRVNNGDAMQVNLKKNSYTIVRWGICVCLLVASSAFAQRNEYSLSLRMSASDSLVLQKAQEPIKVSLSDSIAVREYLKQFIIRWHRKGYAAASVDQFEMQANHADADVYIGDQFSVDRIGLDQETRNWLEQTNFSFKRKKPSLLDALGSWEQQLIDHAANHGYPFASVKLDSFRFDSGKVDATLFLQRDVFYRLDSIRQVGEEVARTSYVYRLLQMHPGMPFNQDKINRTPEILKSASFITSIQSPDITYLGSGALMNLYLNPVRSSQFNALLGWQPATDARGKTELIADVHLDLQHYFGRGERMFLRWQQLQPQSPRLNLALNRPFIFNSDFGVDFQFDLFKKDSSFLQWQTRIGSGFQLNSSQQGLFFLLWQQASLLPGSVDTLQIRQSGQLPVNVDYRLSQAGFQWKWTTTDRRLNPMNGWESDCNLAIGQKKILPNQTVLQIKGMGFQPQRLYDSLGKSLAQMRWRGNIIRYVSFGKFFVLKTSLQTGWLASSTLFRNEWFQIGGQQTLRGFDEESIYASSFVIGSVECRRLLGPRSFGSLFTEFAQTSIQGEKRLPQGFWVSGGVGLSYETKAGLLNLSLATGIRPGEAYSLRDHVKLHFGIQNYF
jgi:outer membrane protein assembly factor BamA